MTPKIRVYGKAQNRTALGIINAYLLIRPDSSLADLQSVFPDSLNPDSGARINFVELSKVQSVQSDKWDGFFTGDDEVLTLADGTQVAVVKMWTKPSLQRITERALEYGIEVAEFTDADKGVGRKGGYRLEFLNDFVPVVVVEKKKSRWWVWLLLLLLIAAAILFFTMRSCHQVEPKVIVQRDTVTVVRIDTVYQHYVEEIEDDFNAAQYDAGSYELNDEAKFALHDLAKLMKKQEELTLRIVGHTSVDGTPEYNQQLSEQRAKAAVDFLISQGVSEDRLQYEGKGSSEPTDPNDPELNRRTEFIIK